MTTRYQLTATVFALAALAGCNVFSRYVVPPGTTAKLINDTDRVRSLLRAGAARDADIESKWRKLSRAEQIQKVSSGEWLDRDDLLARRLFIQTMSGNSGVDIPGSTYLLVVQPSNAACDLLPVPSGHYLKFVVLTGPMKGREGWACDLDIKPKGDWL